VANKTVVVLPGDDAAPEAMAATMDVLHALELPIDFIEFPPGEKWVRGETDKQAREAIDASDTTLFGSTSGKTTSIMYLRWGKQTYANVRPAKWSPGYRSPMAHPDGIDFVIVRENLEDLYLGLEGPLQRWEQVRAQIHDEILERAYDRQRHTFTQSYGSAALDAGALMVGLVGLLDPADGRFTGTIDAVRCELGHDGFISRYSTDATDEGLSGSEGQFLACSFWLVETLALNGREAEARELFERLLALRNDLGLYAEELRTRPRPAGRQLPPVVHPSGPDQRGQGPQRRADRDTIHAARAAAAPAGATTQACPRGADATIAACPVPSCLVAIAGFCCPIMTRRETTGTLRR